MENQPKSALVGWARCIYIAAIYGLKKSAGTTALVMELVEGPTLADRIGKAIPVDEVLPIAKRPDVAVLAESPAAM